MEINSALFDSIFTEELFALSPPPAIIIDQPWESVTSSERLLLEKILAAVKQSFNSISIHQQVSLDLSHWVEKPKQVIYFGKPVKGVPSYEVVEANGVAIVAADRLSDLSQNDEARKKLWQALRKQFSV